MNTIKKYSGYFTITECVDFILQNVSINLKAATIRHHLYTAIHAGNLPYKMLGKKMFQLSKINLKTFILLKYSIHLISKSVSKPIPNTVKHLSSKNKTFYNSKIKPAIVVMLVTITNP